MGRYARLLLLVLALQTLQASVAAERTLDGALHAGEPAGVRRDFGDLPLYEVRANGASETLGLLITGDGGWADLDQHVSAALAQQGISIVALSSLKYFWSSRTPEGVANDVAQVLRHYTAVWGKSRIMLIGYSFGADVMPFIVNRLPEDLRARLVSVNLLGLGTDASFQVSVAKWVHGSQSSALPLAPELSRIGDVPVLCIYGEGEKDTLCPGLARSEAVSLRVGRGHHFSRDYGMLAEEIATFSSQASAR